jgi:hypothetical protein
MFGIRTRVMAATLLATLSSPMALMAQWGMFNDCSCYTPTPAPIVSQASACYQPVTQMVSQQMEVTEFKTVQREEKRPVQKMRMVSRPVTAYRQVVEAQTVEVPVTSYQTVTEMVPRTINQSRWQTVSQPVAKMSPCQYDNRPTLMGRMNRISYSMRSSMQPNTITHRQFVPQVCQVNVPVQRQVAVQSTRQVTQHVAKMVAYQTTQQVAEAYTDYETVKVTSQEPVKVMRTVQVPVTRMAQIDPITGAMMVPSNTQTVEEKQPTRAAEGNDPTPNGTLPKNISYPKPAKAAPSNDRAVIRRDSSPEPSRVAVTPVRPRAASASASVATVETAGWKAHKPSTSKTEIAGPKLVISKSAVASK